MKSSSRHFSYFPNRDGLIFIAVFLVLVSHIEIFNSNSGKINFAHILFIEKIDDHAATLFFVLGGFLIERIPRGSAPGL